MSVSAAIKNTPPVVTNPEDPLFSKDKTTSNRASFGATHRRMTFEQSPFSLDSYHHQNQIFLEEANARKEPLTLEELAALERRRLSKSPAHQFAQEEARSQQSKIMTPSFVFRLSQQMHGSSKSPFPIRKHHLEPIVGDDECSYSEVVSVSSSEVFSAKDALSVSSSGMWSCKDYVAVATTAASTRDTAKVVYERKDHRDDDVKYISSPESSERMAKSVEESSGPNEETREKQASSDDAKTKGCIDTIKSSACGSGHAEYETSHPKTNKNGKTKESVNTRPHRKYRERKERSKEDEYLRRFTRELEFDRDIILADWKHQFVGLDQDEEDWEDSGGMCSYLCRKFVDPCIGSVINVLRWEPVDALSCTRSPTIGPRRPQAYLLPPMIEGEGREHYGSVREQARNQHLSEGQQSGFYNDIR